MQVSQQIPDVPGGINKGQSNILENRGYGGPLKRITVIHKAVMVLQEECVEQ